MNNRNSKTNGREEQGTLREKRIVLVVDPDLVSRFYTSIVLQRLNYHVIQVRSAEEAFVIMELTMPLIIITEISLPQMSGVDLLKQVKHDPRTRNIPVLIYTAANMDAQRAVCQAVGCAGFLLHTPDHNLLYEAVQQATEPKPRHFIRLKTSLNATVVAPGHKDQVAKVTAISEHGMFVVTEQPLPFGAKAEYTLYLPAPYSDGIILQGQVLYSDATPGPGKYPGMGVKFTDVRPDVNAAINEFIEATLMQGIVPERQALQG